MTIEITSWSEVGSPLANPELDTLEPIFTTGALQTGLTDLAANTEYWSTSGSIKMGFKVPPAINWEDWLDWAYARWTSYTKEEVRANYTGDFLTEIALLSVDNFFGPSTALKVSTDLAGIKAQPVPLPTPESFTDPVEKARWHVFWNLDRCMNLAKESGAIIIAEY